MTDLASRNMTDEASQAPLDSERRFLWLRKGGEDLTDSGKIDFRSLAIALSVTAAACLGTRPD